MGGEGRAGDRLGDPWFACGCSKHEAGWHCPGRVCRIGIPAFKGRKGLEKVGVGTIWQGQEEPRKCRKSKTGKSSRPEVEKLCQMPPRL